MPISFFPGERLTAAGPLDGFPHVRDLIPAPKAESGAAFADGDLLIDLAYRFVPESVWDAAGGRIGLCLDARLLWHLYRLRVPDLDAVLCPPGWAGRFRLAGAAAAHEVYAAGPDDVPPVLDPDRPRRIDVLVTGNLNPAVHPERARALGALAEARPEWAVRFVPGLAPSETRSHLAGARLVVRWADPDDSDSLLADATAAGALTLQNADGFGPLDRARAARFAVVPVTAADLIPEIGRWLADEEGRCRRVRAAQAAPPYRFWEGVEAGLAAVRPTTRPRDADAVVRRLRARCWQASATGPTADTGLAGELERGLAAVPTAWGHSALAVGLLGREARTAARAAAAVAAVRHLRRALELDPRHAVARLNLVDALAASGRPGDAADEARRALAAVDPNPAAPADWLDDPTTRTDFGPFRVAWEAAAWRHPADRRAETRAKCGLLRWAFHSHLAADERDTVAAYEAYLARPDLAASAATLGRSLARANRPLEAVGYLGRALEENPLDPDSASVLGEALHRLGERDAQAELARRRVALGRALGATESWAERVPPPADELVSIVILCCGVVEMTRLCLDSLLATTRPAYELILVDNGSRDDTPAYLREVATRPGPARVAIVTNAENRGFAFGCNQGLAEARGRLILFLNNDVVLTPEWLEGLVGPLRAMWATVGAVGPVANVAPDAQNVRAGYDDLGGLPAFAARRAAEFAGQAVPVTRLTGFCLLARRDVLDRIGAFDERFGTGFFEDDDLCARITGAGWQLAVAPAVYVHHFGSSTFKSLGLDTARLLAENLVVYRAKWGEERTRGYRLVGFAPDGRMVEGPPPEPAPPADPAPAGPGGSPRGTSRRQPITLTMIVRDEEANLPDCLRTAADLFDEVVVADTGSSDDTRAVARSFGARVVEFPWADSFAAARNASLEQVRTPWAMWLDADDRLDDANRDRLRALFDGLGDRPDAHAVQVRSGMDPQRTAFRLLDQVRVFPVRPEVRWEYRVHEQILPGVRRIGGGVRWSEAVVDHTGYQQPTARQRKLERNLRLLELDAADRPTDAFTLFNLGWTKLDVGRTAEAYDHLKASLDHSAADSSIVRKLYDLLAHACRALNRDEEAAEWLDRGLADFPDDCELSIHRAGLYADRRDPVAAGRCLERVLHAPTGRYFGSHDEGARGYRTRHRLAELYRDQGRRAEAEVQWRAAAAEQPRFGPAYVGLGELLLADGRWDEAGAAADGLASAGDAMNAAILRSRVASASGRHDEARRVAENVVAEHPALLGPRVLLSHVLLREGRDWPAALAALDEILRLDPGHPEAAHNRALLLRDHPHLAALPRPRVVVAALVFDPTHRWLRRFVRHHARLGADRVLLFAADVPAVREAVADEPGAVVLPADPLLSAEAAAWAAADDAEIVLRGAVGEWLYPRHAADLPGALAGYPNDARFAARRYAIAGSPPEELGFPSAALGDDGTERFDEVVGAVRAGRNAGGAVVAPLRLVAWMGRAVQPERSPE